jgi:hypothetical protein
VGRHRDNEIAKVIGLALSLLERAEGCLHLHSRPFSRCQTTAFTVCMPHLCSVQVIHAAQGTRSTKDSGL